MKKSLIIGGILALAAVALGAIGSNVISPHAARAMFTTPVSGITPWVTVMDAGAIDTADASPLIDGDSIDDSTDHTFDMDWFGGTGVVVRVTYQGSVSTSPVIKLFGRHSDSEEWQVLVNRAGDSVVTMTVDTTNDGSDGGSPATRYTTVSIEDHYFDAQGCRYIRPGVQTAQSGGTSSVATLQMKSF